MVVIKNKKALLLCGLIGVTASISGGAAIATSHTAQTSDNMVASGLSLPRMDAANGRLLFGSKACVVCHSVNSIGGEDAPMLAAELMDQPMNPFDFAAKMWRGAEAMVILQREELGNVIQMSGKELADITAFVHDRQEQAKFSTADIPEDIRELMDHLEAEDLGVPHD
ncbi:MAG: hypothetical protein OTI35_14205 [Sulfitobacter sp.]|nr:hypothetical protein [Sulfitobacter sp.]